MEDKMPTGWTALLIEALGGKEKAEAALRQVVGAKCRDAVGRPGATIGDAYTLAVQEGWLAEFLSLTIADLVPHEVVTRPKGKRYNGLMDAIMAHLGAHPGARMYQIREATGAGIRSASSVVGRACKEGRIVARGNKSTMTYYLPADAPKLA